MQADKNNQFGFLGLLTICISAMIGSAIFDLPKNMASVAGLDAQIIAWITTGLGMWMIAETFMILSEVQPQLTGGVYDYGITGFGPLMGFLTSWGYFVANCATNAAFAVLVMNTLNYFFPGTFTGGNSWPAVIGASVLTWSITALTLKGQQSSSRFQRAAIFLMLIVIIIFIITTLSNFNWHLFTTNMQANRHIAAIHDTNLGSIPKQTLATMMITLWMFSGVEGAVDLAAEARDRHQVRTATLVGFCICLIIDVLVSLFSLGVFSYGQLAKMESPATAHILTSLWGSSWGRNVIGLTLILTVLASWISWLEMICELPRHAAEQDGTFPNIFAQTSKSGEPLFAMLLATITIQAIILISHYDSQAYQKLLVISSAMTIPPYLVAEAFLIKIAWQRKYPFHSRHDPRKGVIIGMLAFAYTFIMGMSAGLKYTAAEFIVYACGLPIYHYARHQHHQLAYRSRLERVILVIIIAVAIYGVDLLFGLIKQPFINL